MCERQQEQTELSEAELEQAMEELARHTVEAFRPIAREDGIRRLLQKEQHDIITSNGCNKRKELE